MKSAKIKTQLSPLYLTPVIFAMAAVPLIVLLKNIKMDEVTIKHWIGTEINNDFFSYYKSMLIIVSAAVAVLILFFSRLKDKLSPKPLLKYYIPMSIYALFILISTLLSEYRGTALNGFVDRYEGAYVLLSYIVILFTAICVVDNEKMLKYATIFLFSSACIIGIIGLLQFMGYDIFKTKIGKELILPRAYEHLAETLEFTFGKYTIYSTLYNTNYVGSYMAMLFPLSLVCYLFSEKKCFKFILGLFSCLMFANLIGCRSKTGYIGALIAVIIMIIFLRKRIKEKLFQSIAIFVCFIIVFFGLDALTSGEISERIVNLVPWKTQNYTADISKDNQVYVEDIIIDHKRVTIKCLNESLTLALKDSDLLFYSDNDKELVLKQDADGTIKFEDGRYSEYSAKYFTDQNIMNVYMGGKVLSLYIQEGGFSIVGERGILVNEIEYPDAIGFANKEKFFSSRGYIWSRSLPLLKKTILFGTGPDTYAMVFPQHDYIGKLNAFDKVNEIVDKPHNMYLQIGLNTGLISLLAFVALLAIYIVSSIKTYFNKSFIDYIDVFGVGAFVVVCGYLVTGIANDSLVSVAPVFWAILGLGIGCNYLISHKQEETAGKVKKSIGKKTAGSPK